VFEELYILFHSNIILNTKVCPLLKLYGGDWLFSFLGRFNSHESLRSPETIFTLLWREYISLCRKVNPDFWDIFPRQSIKLWIQHTLSRCQLRV